MVVLVTCKNEDDPIKDKGAIKVLERSQHYTLIFVFTLPSAFYLFCPF